LLYPDRHETETQSLPCNDLRAYITGRAHIVDVIHGNGWATDCYSDDIHPNSHGRKFLADYIAKALAEPVTA
jgi:lysophospholipase L1-like esterase